MIAGTIGAFFLLAEGGWTRAGSEGSTEQEAERTRGNDQLLEHNSFRQFIETIVENVDGEKVGRIKDLIVERQSGEVRYAIMKTGGSIFGHRRRVIVPTTALAMTSAKVGIASIDVTRREWKKAPEFRRQELGALGQPERTREVAAFYRAGGEIARSQLSSNGQKAAQANSPKGNLQLELASDVVGKTLVNRQNQEMGRVTDLLVDFSGKKPALALIFTSQRSRAGESFAVPLRLLSQPREGRMVMNAAHGKFEDAEPFRREVWQAAAADPNGKIYRWGNR